MVGSTGTLMSMRLVRSKLRKREESSTASPTTLEVPLQTNFGSQSRSNSTPNTCDRSHQHQEQQIFTTSSLNECYNSNRITTPSGVNGIEREQVTFTRTSGVGVNANANSNSWVFPPKAPTPNIYSCANNDFLAAADRNGFKGFRKQFSGRFKRLVSKKTEPTPAIPPELKPQLKTIYVY